MNIRFACPDCGNPRRVGLPGTSASHCAVCDQVLKMPAELAQAPLQACVVCSNAEMYRQKDFPHRLGLLILAVSGLAFLTLMLTYHQYLAWAILIGSAAFDGLLYLMVGDVVVCYRCGAHYRGFPHNAEHAPFELSIGERYRQEKIRREQLKAPNPSAKRR